MMVKHSITVATLGVIAMLLVNSVAGSDVGSEEVGDFFPVVKNAKRTLDNLQKKIEHRNVRPDGVVNVDFSEKIMINGAGGPAATAYGLNKLSKPVEDCHDKKFIEHVVEAVWELEIYLESFITIYLDNFDDILVNYPLLESILSPFFNPEDARKHYPLVYNPVREGVRDTVATWKCISKQLLLQSVQFEPIAQRIEVIAEALYCFSKYIIDKRVSTLDERLMLITEEKDTEFLSSREVRKREAGKNATVDALEPLRKQIKAQRATA